MRQNTLHYLLLFTCNYYGLVYAATIQGNTTLRTNGYPPAFILSRSKPRRQTAEESQRELIPTCLKILCIASENTCTCAKKKSVHIFSQDTLVFKQLMTTCMCDSYYCELHVEGVGTASKETEVLTEEVWASGVLSPDTPQGLMQCSSVMVLFVHGGVEHWSLKL